MLDTIKKMTDNDLIKLHRAVYTSIYIDECYGITDFKVLFATEKELIIRGYCYQEDLTWHKNKE